MIFLNRRKIVCNNYLQSLFPVLHFLPQILRKQFFKDTENVIASDPLCKDHTCMPIPLSPDPIRVRSCVWCLF